MVDWLKVCLFVERQRGSRYVDAADVGEIGDTAGGTVYADPSTMPDIVPIIDGRSGDRNGKMLEMGMDLLNFLRYVEYAGGLGEITESDFTDALESGDRIERFVNLTSSVRDTDYTQLMMFAWEEGVQSREVIAWGDNSVPSSANWSWGTSPNAQDKETEYGAGTFVPADQPTVQLPGETSRYEVVLD